ncbi:MAG: Hint domain-containing protein [Pseudomonadota bacterium]
MPQTFSVNVYSAQNLLNGSGDQAFGPDQTGTGNPSGTFTTGTETAQSIDIVDDFNTTDPDQSNDQIDEFDDGTGARQFLGEDVTLTFKLNGSVVTRTFPAGSQVQSEFRLAFDSGGTGTTIYGVRIENPLFGQPGEPELITAGYSVSGGTLPPGTSVGTFDASGSSGNGDVPYASILPCFTPGALIETINGLIAIESLRPGDRVLTRDNGFQTITWTGKRVVDAAELVRHPEWHPIQMVDGPLLSRLHRVLRDDADLSLLTGETELLVEARHLGRSVRADTGVTYLHFACDGHEVVRADGMWVETLLRGDVIDPLMAEMIGRDRDAARPLLRGFEAKAMAGALLPA